MDTHTDALEPTITPEAASVVLTIFNDVVERLARVATQTDPTRDAGAATATGTQPPTL